MFTKIPGTDVFRTVVIMQQRLNVATVNENVIIEVG